MSPVLEPLELAELHREIYIALIRGLLRHGQHVQLARRANITPVHLSLILAQGSDDRLGWDRRWPSHKTARRIANALPAPAYLRQQAYEHMAQALEHRAHLQRAIVERLDDDVTAMTWDVRHASHRATHSADPTVARREYRVLYTLRR